MNRRSTRASTVALTVTALSLVATCATQSDRIGDETHFACKVDDDCSRIGTGFTCRAGTCERAQGPDASVAPNDSGSDGPMPRRDARPPSMPTMEECPQPNPGPPQGRCPLPLPACRKGSSQACWDIPEPPGVDECPLSVAEEYGTRCCSGGSCSFDYGNGCTYLPYELPGQSATGFATCNGGAGAVERVYDATSTTSLYRVAMSDSFVYTLEVGDNLSRLVAISKANCAATPVYESPDYVSGLAAAGNAAYFISGSQIFWAQADLQASPFVTLVPVFGTADVQLAAIGAQGDTAYVIAYHQSLDSGTMASLVAIPCCDSATPRIAATSPFFDLTSDRPLIRDGSRVFAMSELFVLDGTPQLNVAYFDLTTHQASVIFNSTPEGSRSGSVRTQPLGVHGGRVYFDQDRQVTMLDVDTCGATAAVKDRLFDRAPAFASDDHAIYWAETYRDLTVSRIFMKADGADDIVKIAEPSGQVTWLGVDATHLYWAETFDPDTPNDRNAISRIVLPK
jgi:hypothetical protein